MLPLAGGDEKGTRAFAGGGRQLRAEEKALLCK